MPTYLKRLSYFDWFLSVGTVLVGLYLWDPLVLAAGGLGMLMAWYGPAARVKAYLEKRFLRKTPKHTDTGAVAAEDAFYDAERATQALPDAPVAGERPDFRRGLASGPLYLHSSPHNQLKVHYLRLSPGDRASHWA